MIGFAINSLHKNNNWIGIASAILLSLLATEGKSQVYRCMDSGGKTIYTDSPCSKTVKQISSSSLNSNVMDSSGMREQVRRNNAQSVLEQETRNIAAQQQADLPPAARQKVCPSEREIANLETSASSISLGKAERDFLYAEIRRARACKKEDSNYSAEDWRRVREAQSSQSQISQSDRERGRLTAEGIHGASASTREVERMQADKVAEALRAQQPPKPSPPVVIDRCDRDGCWGSDGKRYQRTAVGFMRTDRAQCTVIGSMLYCK
jgi:hypothetical protein